MHLGDLHIGKKVNRFSMLEDQKFVLDQIIKIADEENVSVAVIAGDVYDKSMPPTEAVTIFDEFLTELVRMGVKVLIISGNHDSVERLSFASKLIEKSSVYISRQFSGKVQKVTFSDEFGNVNFFMLPFIRPVDVRSVCPEEEIKDYNQAVSKAVSQIAIDTSERNIIIAHQFITNAQTSDSELLSVGGLDNVEAEIFRDFDYTALGHIHKPQKITNRMRYSGSILKYSFSEIGIEKSVPIIDMREKGRMEIKLCSLKPLHDMIEIKGKYNQLMSPDFYEEIDRDSYIHAVLTDSTHEPDAINKLRCIYKNIMVLDYEKRSAVQSACKAVTDQELELKPIEFVGSFYKEMYGKDMCGKQEEYLKKIIEEVWDK
ncbi:MAG: exonuclease SbcCD subunit D [Porcipelethomonas sp.]